MQIQYLAVPRHKCDPVRGENSERSLGQGHLILFATVKTQSGHKPTSIRFIAYLAYLIQGVICPSQWFTPRRISAKCTGFDSFVYNFLNSPVKSSKAKQTNGSKIMYKK